MDERAGGRISEVERWCRRAREAEGEIDAFLCAWVALTIAAKRTSTSTRGARRLRDYLVFHRHVALEILDRHAFSERRLLGKLEPPPVSHPPTMLEMLDRACWDALHGPLTPVSRLERLARVLVQTENELLLEGVRPPEGMRLRLLTPFVLELLATCEATAAADGARSEAT